MTDDRARMAFCIAMALAAHAVTLGLLGGSGGATTPPALRVTRDADASRAPEATALRASRDQRGDDRYTRRRRAGARAQTVAAAGDAAQRSDAGRPTVTRFVMVAEQARGRRAADDRARATPELTLADMPQSPRTASARADARAAYLARWQAEIENHGSRDYPSALLGGADTRRLTVAVRIANDGSLRGARVLRSSGRPALDRAALTIVHDAAPFAAFDPALADADGTLRFAYDWLFEAGDGRLRTLP